MQPNRLNCDAGGDSRPDIGGQSEALRWRFGARGGTRTRTALSSQGGLSPPCLPIPPPGRHRKGRPGRNDVAQATRGSVPPAPAAGVTEPATDSHRADLARSASGATRPLATTTPSTMSARTAGQGRSRTRTETTAGAAAPVVDRRRRTLRSTPTNRGGERNPGASRPIDRATEPSTFTAPANSRLPDPPAGAARWLRVRRREVGCMTRS